MPEILSAYLVTFGWAITGAISMGCAIVICLRMFDWSTKDVDEWELIKQGNLSMGLIFAATIIALGYVVGSAISP